MAQQISADEALSNALATLQKGRNKIKSNAAVKQQYHLVHTQMTAATSSVAAPLYYVFEHADGGCIVASSDQRTKPLLGYIESGTYADAMNVPAFRYWSEVSQRGLEQELSEKSTEKPLNLKGAKVPEQTITDELNGVTFVIPGSEDLFSTTIPVAVPPLLGDINWNQGTPFSNNCPMLNAGYHAVTGCVATAMAMIMKYHEWPDVGEGSHSYQCVNEGEGINTTLSADFSRSHYDWSNMLDYYGEGAYTDKQASAVAKLLSDIGISVDMSYGSSSGTYHNLAVAALANHFRYNKSMRSLNRSDYTREEWYRLICNDLAEKRPVLMGGTNYSELAGHEFVLDGYDATGLVHVNWGWGGLSNGYFSLDYMNPSSQGIGGSNGGYAGDPQICVGLAPDRTGTSEGTPELYNYGFSLDYDGDQFTFCAINNGQQPYEGQIGVIVMRNDGEGHSTFFREKYYYTSAFEFGDYLYPKFSLNDLGITPEAVGNDCMAIYPVYEKDGRHVVFHSSQPSSGCAYVYWDDYYQDLMFDYGASAKLTPRMESAETVRTYEGYDAVIRVTVSVPEGSSEMACPVLGLVYDPDSGDNVAQVYTSCVIGSGETRNLEFIVPRDRLSVGKTYGFVPLYYLEGSYYEMENTEEFLFSIQLNTAADCSYVSTQLDETTVVKGKTLSGSFVFDNTGGYTENQYVIFIYGSDQNENIYGDDYGGYIAYGHYGVENGHNVIPFSDTVNLAPGYYVGQVYDYDAKEQLDLLFFRVQAPGDVNGDNVVNLNDVKALEEMVAGQRPKSSLGDVNGDNAVTVGDISALAKKMKD